MYILRACCRAHEASLVKEIGLCNPVFIGFADNVSPPQEYLFPLVCFISGLGFSDYVPFPPTPLLSGLTVFYNPPIFPWN